MSAAKGELYRQADGSQQKLPWVNYTQQDPNACPPVLCKIRSLTTAACQSYKVCSCTQMPNSCSLRLILELQPDATAQYLRILCLACIYLCEDAPVERLNRSLAWPMKVTTHAACDSCYAV